MMGGAIIEEASLGRHHGRGDASWRRHQGGGIMEEGQRGGIMEEASWRRHHGEGIHLRFSPLAKQLSR